MGLSRSSSPTERAPRTAILRFLRFSGEGMGGGGREEEIKERQGKAAGM